MSKALFVGRFQPFHMGHLLTIRNILKRHDFIYIIIGSARQKNTSENPFSVDERIEMVKRALIGEGLTNFEISSVEDFHDDKLWTTAIKKAFKFDLAYSQNDWSLDCFRKNEIKTRKNRLFYEKEYSGTEIRKRIYSGKDWKELVPVSVYGYIKSIGGEERIRKLKGK